MKKYLINIAIFFAIVAVLDFSLGKAFYYLQSNKAKGGTESEFHICNGLNEDILVMGSSRAAHHYVPQIFAVSLGMSCYNGGQDGNGIVMQYGRWKMISKQHLPKLIIYDIEPSFDLKVDDNTRYIDRLKPFADDRDVKGFVASVFPMERFKLLSRMYRYNYKFLEIFSDCVRPSNVNSGYKPNNEHIRAEVIGQERESGRTTLPVLDPVKMDCLQRLVTEAQSKGIKVVLVSSPYWKGFDDIEMSQVRAFAEENGVLFIDYADSELRENPDLYADSMHLNDKGAKKFSSDLVGKLKAYLGV